MLSVNLRGVMLCCRAVLPVLQRRRGGLIINIASVAATRAIVGAAVYAATKAGVIAFSRTLAEEVRADGIRVGVIVPGAVVTALWDAIGDPPARERMLRPEDVARAAVLMATQAPHGVLEEITLMPAAGIL
jgi:NADP-dependent 3-hydroxy acid dehydrogenase YdfG